MLEYRVWDKTNKIMTDKDVDVFVRGDGYLYVRAEDTYNTPHTEIELASGDLVLMLNIEDTDSEGNPLWQDDVVLVEYKEKGLIKHIEKVWIKGLKLGLDCEEDYYDELVVTKLGNVYENPEQLEKLNRIV